MPVRVRQHVNPLSRRFQVPLRVPDWSQVYGRPGQQFHLDVGCGKGRFLLEMAAAHPGWNFLGIEIRLPLVEQARRWAGDEGLTNVCFLAGHAGVGLGELLAALPKPGLYRVSIQFPDPWFKRKQQKRRVVQTELVSILAAHLQPGGQVFLQSDVREVAAEMAARFQADPRYTCLGQGIENPMGIPTERERSTLSRGLPVYRSLWERRSN